LIIISEFVIVLKSKKTAYNFLLVLVKFVNYTLNLQMEGNQRNWIIILLKNYLSHLHFEYDYIEISLIDASKLIKTIINCLFATEANDFHSISMIISICKFIDFKRKFNFLWRE